MKPATPSMLIAASATLIPTAVLAQAVGPPSSSRAYTFVLLAFAAGWLLIGAWVFQIGRKVKKLSDRMERDASD